MNDPIDDADDRSSERDAETGPGEGIESGPNGDGRSDRDDASATGESDRTGVDGSADDAEPVDPAAVVDDLEDPVILFDGVCNLCNGFVRFVVRFDSEGTFRFAPLQSPVGGELLRRHGFGEDPVDGDSLGGDSFDTIVLVEDDAVTTKSTAVLRIARRLDGPWPLLSPLLVLPRFVRDAAYDVVSSNRYRLFGKQDACPLPDPEVRERFAERSLD